MTINHDVGIMPSLGLTWHQHAFRDDPYSSMVSLVGSYSFQIAGYRIALRADQRKENSALHHRWAQVSQLELVNFHGLGNSSPQTAGQVTGVTAPRNDFYAVNQTQWLLQPAIALALGPATNLSFGPVLKYFDTDSTPDRLCSPRRSWPSGLAGEAGLRIGLSHNSRNPPHATHTGTVLDLRRPISRRCGMCGAVSACSMPPAPSISRFRCRCIRISACAPAPSSSSATFPSRSGILGGAQRRAHARPATVRRRRRRSTRRPS